MPATSGGMLERKWWTLTVACVAIFMLLLDITVVNVALPDIRRDLDASFTDLQWVVDAYALSLAALLLTAGALADLLGRRRVFVLGLGLFTGASVLCGLAGSPLILNLARGLQGVGGAVMFATSLALIAQEFEGRERGVAFGIWGATTGGAVALGPLVGGALTESLGWQWIFFVNAPIGLAAGALALLRVRESRDPGARGVDWGGVLTFSGALAALVLALIRGNDEGWSSPLIVGLLATATLLLVAFFLVERAQERPMLDLELFRKPAFTGASIVAFALSASMFSSFLYLTLYLQNVLGHSPLEAGLRFLPLTLLSFLVAPVAGRLSVRVPVRALIGVGLLLVAAGLVAMAGLEGDSRWTALLVGFLLAGAGIGLTNPPLASTAIGVVPPARTGMASGISTTFRQIGIATGIAALGAAFEHRIHAKVVELTAGTPLAGAGASEELSRAVAAGASEEAVRSASAGSREAIAEVARESFIAGLNEILLIAGLVALVGAICGFALIRTRDLVGAHGPAEEPVAAAAAT